METGTATRFDALSEELAQWERAGRVATFWWRDDDAPASATHLERMLAVGRAWGVSCGLAVVPTRDLRQLHAQLLHDPVAQVLLHGYTHTNHAPEGAPPSELGPERPVDEICDELRAGREILYARFGHRFVPMLVPPWHGVGAELLRRLPALDLPLYSVKGPPQDVQVPGLTHFPMHFEVGVDEAGALKALCEHLRARRLGTVPDEPTGVLTHHWALTDDVFVFLERILELVRDHPATRWLRPSELLTVP